MEGSEGLATDIQHCQYEPMPYLRSAEALTLILTGTCWARVWSSPTEDRLRLAALSSALLVLLRAFELSLSIIVGGG